MFEHLLQARPAPDRTTFHTTRAHAGKHAFLAWLSAPRLRSDHKPPAVSRLALLPVIALALAGTTLLACGTSDTSEPTVSEQRTPASAQPATRSMPPTAGTTPDGPSNGQSASDTPTTQPREQTTREQPTKPAAAQETKPTPEPTAPPTKAPMPTATCRSPSTTSRAVLAPSTAPQPGLGNEIIQRMDDNGEPIYPLSEIKGGGDPKYPQYPSNTESGKPKYPGLASRLQYQNIQSHRYRHRRRDV